ncbi:acylphosphatase [Arthrobacter sp. fls2-241-R2A-200]|uniref:acylphosphatase n=1 Tax=Arthrobacter sp. fls2-241-R2A-200 TaxID=3040281 RepID=UPI002551B0CC|nr:acylphosphatase [Arthrobacter sp. fls2-241-R2A-200]
MAADQVRLTARVTGVVQGVGFRYGTARKARELALKGTVRNTTDGAVELIAEGQVAEVENLAGWLHSKHAPGRVEDVDFRIAEATGEFDDFRIVG